MKPAALSPALLEAAKGRVVLSYAETAALLGCSRSTVVLEVARGHLRTLGQRKAKKVLVDSLHEFITNPPVETASRRPSLSEPRGAARRSPVAVAPRPFPSRAH